jgi:hypothetical protein
MDLLTSDQFINNNPLFSINAIIIIISEYISLKCKSFIDFLKISINLEHLYTYYEYVSIIEHFSHAVIPFNEYKKVRYLKHVLDTVLILIKKLNKKFCLIH